MTKYAIDFGAVPDDELQGHDQMMIKCILTVRDISALSMQIWAATLKELERRGKVQLVRGTYDDLGNAAIVRLYV